MKEFSYLMKENLYRYDYLLPVREVRLLCKSE